MEYNDLLHETEGVLVELGRLCRESPQASELVDEEYRPSRAR